MEINYYAIILSLGILILKRFSTNICKVIQLFFNKSETHGLKKYYDELSELKKERDDVSMIDSFAQYALIDRKINKIMDQIQIHKNETRTKNLSKIM